MSRRQYSINLTKDAFMQALGLNPNNQADSEVYAIIRRAAYNKIEERLDRNRNTKWKDIDRETINECHGELVATLLADKRAAGVHDLLQGESGPQITEYLFNKGVINWRKGWAGKPNQSPDAGDGGEPAQDLDPESQRQS